jgi:hypothetical protein
MLESAILYLVVGAGVAAAVYLRSNPSTPADKGFSVAAAIFFWPVFVPTLFEESKEASVRSGDSPVDEISQSIHRVEQELDSAFSSLDGWAEDVLARQHPRLGELKAAWLAQAQRIRDLDGLLAREQHLRENEIPVEPDDERIARSQRARNENLDRLNQLRRRAHLDLMSTIAWVRELATMIHLAKFTGAPAARAEELVAQIAAAVEGLSEASTWSSDRPPALLSQEAPD